MGFKNPPFSRSTPVPVGGSSRKHCPRKTETKKDTSNITEFLMVSFLPPCLVQDVGTLDLASQSDVGGEKGIRYTVHKHPDSEAQAADL